LQVLLDSLTPREREVLALVSSGLMNKQVAAELGLAEITVKLHRGHIMRKMGAKSLCGSGENGRSARNSSQYTLASYKPKYGFAKLIHGAFIQRGLVSANALVPLQEGLSCQNFR